MIKWIKNIRDDTWYVFFIPEALCLLLKRCTHCGKLSGNVLESKFHEAFASFARQDSDRRKPSELRGTQGRIV